RRWPRARARSPAPPAPPRSSHVASRSRPSRPPPTRAAAEAAARARAARSVAARTTKRPTPELSTPGRRALFQSLRSAQVARQAGERVGRDRDVRGIVRVVAPELDPRARAHGGPRGAVEFEADEVDGRCLLGVVAIEILVRD